jgi:hypothetical protein
VDLLNFLRNLSEAEETTLGDGPVVEVWRVCERLESQEVTEFVVDVFGGTEWFKIIKRLDNDALVNLGVRVVVVMVTVVGKIGRVRKKEIRVVLEGGGRWVI